MEQLDASVYIYFHIIKMIGVNEMNYRLLVPIQHIFFSKEPHAIH